MLDPLQIHVKKTIAHMYQYEYVEKNAAAEYILLSTNLHEAFNSIVDHPKADVKP